jgi:uncharacterized membrane protein
MLVHFPAALLPADLFFMVASVYLKNESLAQAAYYCLLAGVLCGAIAILTGLYDLFIYLLKTQSQGIRKGFIHGGIQTTVILGFTVIAGIEYNNAGLVINPPAWIFLIKGTLVLMMFVGNYMGAEVLFRHVIKRILNL